MADRDKRRYSLDDHPEHRAQLGPWRDRWIHIALSTAPPDWPVVVEAVEGLCRAARLVPPPRSRIVRVASPMTATIAGGVAAGVWWLRRHPESHVAVVGRPLSEADLLAAIPVACAAAVSAGMAELRGDPRPVSIYAATITATHDATGTATGAATRSATRAATIAATYAATAEATDAATYAATAEATIAAIDAATYAATGAATRDATGTATIDATYAATAEATDAATRAVTRDTTRDATGAATRAATRTATIDATYAAIDAATDGATRNATDAATRAATDAATYAATDAATYAATAEAIDAATAEATAEAIDAAIDAAIDDATGRVVSYLLRCVGGWWSMADYGSDWSAWPSFLSFFHRVAGLDLPIYERWRHYETLAEQTSVRVMPPADDSGHVPFVIVSDRQTAIYMDGQRQLHREDGPARTWGDGWAVWYWHGQRVPRSLIEDGWTVQRILREPNVEIRRCAIERIGWDRFVAEAGLSPVDSAPDPGNPGQVMTLYDLPEQVFEEPVRLLLVINGSVERDGTRRRFGLTVPATVTTALDAQAWIHDDPDHPVRVTADLYAQLQRRS